MHVAPAMNCKEKQIKKQQLTKHTKKPKKNIKKNQPNKPLTEMRQQLDHISCQPYCKQPTVQSLNKTMLSAYEIMLDYNRSKITSLYSINYCK